MKRRVWVTMIALALSLVPLPVTRASAAVWTVDRTADGKDSAPGDGVCYSTAAKGCSLRAAVMEADAHPGSATIQLAAATYVLTSTIFIEDSTTLRGAGAGQTIISGGNRVTPLWIRSVSYLVCDQAKDRLISVDRNGAFGSVWSASGAGHLDSPVAAHLINNDDPNQTSDDVLVTGTSGVHRFTSGGTSEGRLVNASDAGIPFPADATPGPSDSGTSFTDHVYLADYTGGRIRRFNQSGGGATTIVPRGRGGLRNPNAVAFHDGVMYVVDAGGNAVRRYKPDGTYLGSSPTGAAPRDIVFRPNGSFVVSSSGTDDVATYGADGQLDGVLVPSGSGGLDGAGSMALGPDGSLLVVSTNTRKVLQYDLADGTYERVFTASSSHLNRPSCLLQRAGVADGPLVVLDDLTVTGGQADLGLPGGIVVDPGARLHVDDSVVTGNHGSTFGGGIGNYGHLLLLRSAVTDNDLPPGGGGVTSTGGGVFNAGLLEVEQSTISGNTAVRGGGIGQTGGTTKVTNATISDNTAAGGSGGGLRITGGQVSLSYATVTANRSVAVSDGDATRLGGGLDNEGGTVTMAGSVLAGNHDGREHGTSGYSPDCFAPAGFTSNRANLVGVLTTHCHLKDATTGTSGTGNLIGARAGLLGLAPAPGFVFGVHAVAGPGSAVVRAARSSHAPCPATDQLGVARPGSRCDIGAVQLVA